jgi:very-short-patch-repair endonuclease
MKRIPQKFIEISRKLRKNETPWEIKLWNYLRDRRLNGCKFKRQVRLGKYIADFYCAEKRLVVELDGGQHSEIAIHEHDQEKENYLKSEGLTILRFWNNEVDSNFEGVLETIRKSLL